MRASKKVFRQAADLFRACLVNGSLSEDRVRSTLQLLVKAKPRGYLATLGAFRRLVQLESARHSAKIESAQKLSADTRADLLRTLEEVYGSGLSTSFTENPALLGGVRIQVGSDVYDGSVRGRLAALERSL